MQDRYEIRDKLGQGGLGAVYRAYDQTLKREVAIKRIAVSDNEPHNEEATKQMTQETGALAALQHPHIVTIYDVGTDDEGPFVVMELLKGKTIDEIVESTAPLTWKDFREFAMQVQEGLVAAQDLGLVHRDLKPSNLMLNWLPSGKFQVKIVDFGLAKFAAEPIFQDVTEGDAVYGSIFFMAPEQFERKKIDTRTDMYAIGCVYYFALTGEMPFQGETGPQVMAAHLEHRVVPISEIRPDLPTWVCDWIMWHINRLPEDRPENSREALQNFIELDVPKTETMSATAPQPPAPKRPRLIVPGAVPVAPAPVAPSPASEERPSPPVTQTMPKPLKPPEDAPPSLHTTSQQASDASTAEAAPGAPPPAAAVIPTVQLKTAGGPPTASIVPTARVAGTQTAQPTVSEQAGFGQTSIGSGPTRKAGLSGSAKIAIYSVLGLLILLAGWMLVIKMGDNKINKRYNELVELAAMPTTKELPVTREDTKILLDSVRTGANKSRETVYKALAIAETTDGSDADEMIARFATEELLTDDIRIALLSRVLRKRANPSSLNYLLEYSKETANEEVAAAALTAVTDIGGEDQIDNFIDVIEFSSSTKIRKAAEGALESILARSAHREKWGENIASKVSSATDDSTRRTMIRLLGVTGGEASRKMLTEVLNGDDKLDQLAAIEAMKSWPDDSMFAPLMDFLSRQADETIRPKAFNAGYVFLMDDKRERSDKKNEELWRMLADNAKTPKEQDTMISGLVSIAQSEWPIEIIENFAETSDNDRVIDRSGEGIKRIRERLKILEGSKKDFDEE